MRSLVIFLILIALASLQGRAQKKAPDEKSIVKKEYDENGNLIQFDSTYVWSWNSDSTMNFSFDENLAFGKEIPEFFGEFNADSVFEKFGFLNRHQFQPFNNDDFFRQFQHSFSDSMLVHSFPFETDSTFTFQFNDQFPGYFDFPDIEELQKQFQEQFKQHSYRVPEFKSPEQKKEWEKLMQKQQKEKSDLLKKWENPQLKQN